MSLDTSQSSWRSREDYFHQLQLDFQSVPGSAWDFPCMYPRKLGDVSRNMWDHTGVTHLGFLSHGEFAKGIWEHSCLGCMENVCPSRFFLLWSRKKCPRQPNCQEDVQNMETTCKIRAGKVIRWLVNPGMSSLLWGHFQPPRTDCSDSQEAKPQLLLFHLQIQDQSKFLTQQGAQGG